MSKRLVTRTERDKNGEIFALCHDGEYWSPVFKNTAIKEIESGLHSYFIENPVKGDISFRVIEANGRKILRADSNV